MLRPTAKSVKLPGPRIQGCLRVSSAGNNLSSFESQQVQFQGAIKREERDRAQTNLCNREKRERD